MRMSHEVGGAQDFFYSPLDFFSWNPHGAGCFPSAREATDWHGQDWSEVRGIDQAYPVFGAWCEFTCLTDSLKTNVYTLWRCIICDIENLNVPHYHVSFVLEWNGRVAWLCIIGVHGLPWKHLRDPQGMIVWCFNCDRRCLLGHTKWAPTSFKFGYNPYTWSYDLLTGAITSSSDGWGPPCDCG